MDLLTTLTWREGEGEVMKKNFSFFWRLEQLRFPIHHHSQSTVIQQRIFEVGSKKFLFKGIKLTSFVNESSTEVGEYMDPNTDVCEISFLPSQV